MASKSEFIYIFTNPCMPDWIKVGKTKNVKRRLSELDCTAVPLPFECYAYLEVPADLVFKVESGLHKILGRSLDQKKEFFRTNADTVLDYFRNIEGFNNAFHLVLHPDLESRQDKKIASSTNFEMLQIPLGSKLYLVNNPEIFCTVSDSFNQVTYAGESWSISGLACHLLDRSVSGYQAFMFEDETLWARRQRLHPGL